MVVVRASTKRTAKLKAKVARRRGLNATVFKKKKGYGTSITRK